MLQIYSTHFTHTQIRLQHPTSNSTTSSSQPTFFAMHSSWVIAAAVAKYPTFTTTTHPTLSCYDYPLKCGSGMTFLCKIYYYHYIPCPFPFLLQNKRERWKERMDYSLLYFHRRHHHHLHIIRRPLLLFISNNTNLVTFMDSTLELLFFYSRKKKKLPLYHLFMFHATAFTFE